MKYIFFGTPEFASIILQGLIDAGIAPVGLVCNPDKPVGRKKIITAPPTKEVALKYGIEVFQPETKNDLVALSPTLAAKADFAVVTAYAKIIPQDVIDQFKLGIIGVHPSLLPKFRGPSPIQSAILSGEETTGTTLFMLAKGVDDGLVLQQGEINIEDKNYETLIKDLGELSLQLLVKILPDFDLGKTTPTSQDEGTASFTSFFEGDAGLVKDSDLNDALRGDKEKSLKIWRMIRALNPEPGVYTFLNGKRTKLLAARIDGDRLVLERIQKDGKKPEILI